MMRGAIQNSTRSCTNLHTPANTPRVVVYPNFIDAARCDHIISLARTKLRGSDLAWRPDEEAVDDQVGVTVQRCAVGFANDMTVW